MIKICSIDDCDKKLIAKGLCSMHYCRMRKHGDPLIKTKSWMIKNKHIDDQGNIICKKCNDYKSSDQYTVDKDGYYRSVCKICVNSDPNKKLSTRRSKLMSKYNMTLEDFDFLFGSQDKQCKISGRDQSDSTMAVDHCHDCGTIRGIIDMKINLALSNCYNDPEILRAAADYLEKHLSECDPERVSDGN